MRGDHHIDVPGLNRDTVLLDARGADVAAEEVLQRGGACRFACNQQQGGKGQAGDSAHGTDSSRPSRTV